MTDGSKTAQLLYEFRPYNCLPGRVTTNTLYRDGPALKLLSTGVDRLSPQQTQDTKQMLLNDHRHTFESSQHTHTHLKLDIHLLVCIRAPPS